MITQTTSTKTTSSAPIGGQALEQILAQLASDAGRALVLDTLHERGMIIETPYTPDEARAARKTTSYYESAIEKNWKPQTLDHTLRVLAKQGLSERARALCQPLVDVHKQINGKLASSMNVLRREDHADSEDVVNNYFEAARAAEQEGLTSIAIRNYEEAARYHGSADSRKSSRTSCLVNAGRMAEGAGLLHVAKALYQRAARAYMEFVGQHSKTSRGVDVLGDKAAASSFDKASQHYLRAETYKNAALAVEQLGLEDDKVRFYEKAEEEYEAAARQAPTELRLKEIVGYWMARMFEYASHAANNVGATARAQGFEMLAAEENAQIASLLNSLSIDAVLGYYEGAGAFSDAEAFARSTGLVEKAECYKTILGFMRKPTSKQRAAEEEMRGRWSRGIVEECHTGHAGYTGYNPEDRLE